MKNIFLTSFAKNTLDTFVDSLDSPATELVVGFIPTAGNIITDNWFVKEDRNKLLELGFKVIDINLESKTKNQLLEEMDVIDIIFVAGGNTFYLLQEVLKSGFNEIIISFVEKGGIYIGSSAGTLLAGPSIELAKDIDDEEEAPDLATYDALSLVDFVVLPHCDNEYFKDTIDKILQKHKEYKHKIITISDNQAVVIDENSFSIINS